VIGWRSIFELANGGKKRVGLTQCFVWCNTNFEWMQILLTHFPDGRHVIPRGRSVIPLSLLLAAFIPAAFLSSTAMSLPVSSFSTSVTAIWGSSNAPVHKSNVLLSDSISGGL
jgi:hypothetical protein